MGFLRRVPVISLAAVLTTPAFAQRQPRQSPPLEQGTSSITGRVVNAQSNQPAEGVEVTIALDERSSTVTTKADGRYAFENIAEGSYLLATGSRDYLAGCYPSSDASDRCGRIVLARDEHRTGVNFSVLPAGIARGRVVDSNGAPIADATVRLGSPAKPSTSTMHTIYFGAVARTDKDGAFEVRGIVPGEWNLELDVPNTRDSIRLPVLFYPGVFRADDAMRFEFVSGRIVNDLVFVIPSVADNTLTIHVSAHPVPLSDVRTSFIVPGSSARGIALNDQGIGTIKGLLDGRYFISVRSWTNDQAWAAFEIAEFIAPSLDVALQIKPAGTIKGKIVARNGGLPPLNNLVAAALWVDGDVEINPGAPDQVPVETDGSFKIDGLFGRRAIKLLQLSPEWRLYSVLQGRSDVTSGLDVPLDTVVELTLVVARQ
jgi:hypothetical protein